MYDNGSAGYDSVLGANALGAGPDYNVEILRFHGLEAMGHKLLRDRERLFDKVVPQCSQSVRATMVERNREVEAMWFHSLSESGMIPSEFGRLRLEMDASFARKNQNSGHAKVGVHLRRVRYNSIEYLVFRLKLPEGSRRHMDWCDRHSWPVGKRKLCPSCG